MCLRRLYCTANAAVWQVSSLTSRVYHRCARHAEQHRKDNMEGAVLQAASTSVQLCCCIWDVRSSCQISLLGLPHFQGSISAAREMRRVALHGKCS